MFEWVITDLLGGYMDNYLEGFSSDMLKVGIGTWAPPEGATVCPVPVATWDPAKCSQGGGRSGDGFKKSNPPRHRCYYYYFKKQ
jgi:hypothetical protein